jgi:hypothetical protein
MKQPVLGGGIYGSEKIIEPQVRAPEVQQRGEQKSRERDGPAQTWQLATWEIRSWRQGEEPEAGGRDRVVGSAQEGGKGPCSEGPWLESAEELHKAEAFEV